MLLEKTINEFASAGIAEVKRATIKTSPKIFNFFADQTYANKPRAICRELVANAWDSHQMAGKGDVPVEVWLPTILEPTFRVRDHGIGMSHSFMMNEFMCYADGSTKDQSNIAIGGFGIGSKSPFAYVDQYTVISRFDGTESVYSVFKDAEGIPAIGLLGQRPTDEPNGVEVAFPVKPDDFETFEEAAFESLRFFEPLPDIRNATEGKFNPPEYVARGKSWGMREHAGDLQIIMGGVMYPVSINNLSYRFPSNSAAYKLLRYGLDLRVPIGTCSVALSREALSYDDKTIDGIRVTCEAVIDEIAETFANMFDKYDSAWEAAAALHREINDTRGDRGNFLNEHARWRGQPHSTWLTFPQLSTHEYLGKRIPTWGYEICEIADERGRRGRGGRTRRVTTSWATPDNGYDRDKGFEPGRVDYLLIDDLPQKPSSKAARKIKEFAEDCGKRLLVIRPENGVNIDLEKFGDPPADKVVFTSSLPEPVMERGYSRARGDRPKVRMFTYNGSYQRRHNWSAPALRISPEREGVFEIPYADQPPTGILVVMENFIPPKDVNDVVNSGLIGWSELRFVNGADAKKLKGWVGFKDEFERRKKEKLAAYPELPQRLAVAKCDEFRRFFEFFRNHRSVDFTSRKPLGQIFKLYKEYVEPLTNEQHQLARFVTAKLPRGVKPAELVEKFNTKQWRVRVLMDLTGRFEGESLQLLQENL